MKACIGVGLLGVMLGSGAAQGACQFYTGSGPVEAIAQLPHVITVPLLAEVGTLLYSNTYGLDTTNLRCTSDDELDLGWTQDPGPQQGLDGVYYTSVQGVGLRIRERDSQQPLYWPRRREPLPAGDYRASAVYFVEVVKVGPVREGRLELANSGASRRYAGVEATRLRFADDVKIVLEQPTCSVAPDSLSVPVQLGEHRVDDFHGPGSGSALQPFSLRLACHGGGGGQPLYVWLTLTDATQPGNRSEVLSLRSDATAGGIGVQIQFEGKPVAMGPDLSVIHHENQFQAGSVRYGEETFEVPLQARYVQTADRITPGSAGALATFTFAYN